MTFLSTVRLSPPARRAPAGPHPRTRALHTGGLYFVERLPPVEAREHFLFFRKRSLPRQPRSPRERFCRFAFFLDSTKYFRLMGRFFSVRVPPTFALQTVRGALSFRSRPNRSFRTGLNSRRIRRGTSRFLLEMRRRRTRQSVSNAATPATFFRAGFVLPLHSFLLPRPKPLMASRTSRQLARKGSLYLGFTAYAMHLRGFQPRLPMRLLSFLCMIWVSARRRPSGTFYPMRKYSRRARLPISCPIGLGMRFKRSWQRRFGSRLQQTFGIPAATFSTYDNGLYNSGFHSLRGVFNRAVASGGVSYGNSYSTRNSDGVRECDVFSFSGWDAFKCPRNRNHVPHRGFWIQVYEVGHPPRTRKLI